MQISRHLQLGEADVDAVEEGGNVTCEQQRNDLPGDPGERRPLKRLVLRRVHLLIPRHAGWQVRVWASDSAKRPS